VEISSLPLPPSPVCSEHPAPSAVCSFSVPCLLFSFFVFDFLGFFDGAGISLPRGLCWFIPGIAVGIQRAAYLLTCWSASPMQVWSWCLAAQEPSCFLSIMWHWEALYRLGVQGVVVLIFLGGFFSANKSLPSTDILWILNHEPLHMSTIIILNRVVSFP
jgi:hypothetical protein